MPVQSKLISAAAASVGLFLGLASGQPILKTGDCPALTRYNAPTGENWTQFPVKATSEFPANTIQNPLDPDKSINCIEVPAGLRAELWASEKTPGGPTPSIAYLQHFTFDERGRMWAVEPRAYPNIIRPASGNINDQKFQGGTDRILILEDTDGDKAMDKVKVFKDGLNLPQGIEVVKGGVVVAMGPYLAYFPNNNDVAGTPQILFSGMGPTGNYDTHGGISSLMYGLDNWIYGHTGYNDCNATSPGLSAPVTCSDGRVWRFRHTALGHERIEFEAWTTGPNNAWGIGQMEDGQIFQSGATISPHVNHSIRKGAAAIDIRNGTAREDFYPITGDRWMWEGRTTKDANGWFSTFSSAVSGMQFYTSRLLPKKYWNRFSFTCEGASKLCNQDSMVVSGNGANTGSTWRAVRMPGPSRSNIIASRDAWVAPILAKTGPDGAVWVLDWYNYLFLHNPASPRGPGFAWENHLREKKHYRIYRVTPASGATEPVLNLANASVAELVAALGNVNLHWRLQAQRLLIERGWSAELGTLLGDILKKDGGEDETGNNPRVVHALWTLHGLGRFTADAATWDPVLKGLLVHPAWGVRRNVLRAMPRTAATAASINEHCAVNDDHGHVRLQALVALSEIAAKPAGMKPLWDTYRTIDTHAGSAFTASGITSSASKECEPAVGIARSGEQPSVRPPRHGLRFTTAGGLLQPLAHGSLPDGELTLLDAAGREVFRSTYRAADRTWSAGPAEIGSGVHVYSFRGADGARIEGRVLSSNPAR